MISKHLSSLGYEATDRVTRFSGVITTVSFDLYGCIQAILTPKFDSKEESKWFDISRLEISNKKVMESPDYEYTHTKPAIVAGHKGGFDKPIP